MEQNSFVESQQSSVPASVSPAPESQAAAEKLVPQSQVNEIVKHAKYEAAQKAKSEAVEEYKRTSQPSQSVGYTPTHSMGGMTQDNIRQIVAEETQKQHQMMFEKVQADTLTQEGARIANEFLNIITVADKTIYPDFDDAVSKLPFKDIPQVVHLANQMENTAAIMYEMAKNPMKMANLQMLANTSPALAHSEMQKLAESIRLNEQSRNVRTANEPLSQIKSSPNAMDNGSMSVKDFQKIFR